MFPAGARLRADIQGLRGVAVLAVVVHHLSPAWLNGGYVGVDVFFVISGFVILERILGQVDAGEPFSLREFYAARARRLLPVAAAGIVVTMLVVNWALPPLRARDEGQAALAAALYNANTWFAWTGTDYLANHHPSVFQHFWSLGVEEQFYLTWPLLLWLALRARVRRPVLGLVLALLSVASFVLCVVVTARSQPWAFFSLPTRAWEFGLGGLLALGVRGGRVRLGTGAAIVVWLLGAVTVLGSMIAMDVRTLFPGYAAALPAFGAVLLIAAGGRLDGNPLIEALERGPLRWVGDRSYSLYVWHWPIVLVPRERGLTVPLVLTLAALVVVTQLSYRLLERRIRFSRTLRASRWRTASLAVALTGVAAGSGSVVHLHDRLDAGRDAPAYATVAARGRPVSLDYVPRNLTPRLLRAGSDLPEIWSSGCHVPIAATVAHGCETTSGDGLRVALFGDSHAAQWYPAVAALVRRHGGTLLTLTKSACPSADVRVWTDIRHRWYTECDAWRASALARLHDFRPDLVLLANRGPEYVDRDAHDHEVRPDQWAEGLRRTIGAFAGASTVVVLGDTPSWDAPVNECLSGHLTDAAACDVPVGHLVDPDIAAAERTAVVGFDARYVETADLVCTRVCGGIIGNVLVYRDASHLTATMAAALAPRLGPRLTRQWQ